MRACERVCVYASAVLLLSVCVLCDCLFAVRERGACACVWQEERESRGVSIVRSKDVRRERHRRQAAARVPSPPFLLSLSQCESLSLATAKLALGAAIDDAREGLAD